MIMEGEVLHGLAFMEPQLTCNPKTKVTRCSRDSVSLVAKETESALATLSYAMAFLGRTGDWCQKWTHGNTLKQNSSACSYSQSLGCKTGIRALVRSTCFGAIV